MEREERKEACRNGQGHGVGSGPLEPKREKKQPRSEADSKVDSKVDWSARQQDPNITRLESGKVNNEFA